MSVKSIEVYYNTSGSDGGGSGTEWFDACQDAGGPSESTICKEGVVLLKDDPTTWKASPGMMGGGGGVSVWRMIGRELLVGGLLAGVMARTLF
jgi:hypothetical protein